MRFLDLFRRHPTASEIGKLGNAVKRDREREAIRARCDEIRERLGLEPARWPE